MSVVHGELKSLLASTIYNHDNNKHQLSLTNVTTQVNNIAQKSVEIPVQNILHGLKQLEDLDNEEGLVQDIGKTFDKQGITTALMCYEFKKHNPTVKFSTSMNQQKLNSDNFAKSFGREKPEGNKNLLKFCSPLQQSWMVDYPLLAYKSFKPDNNQIMIGNFATEQNTQYVVNLGNWDFLCFIGFPNFSAFLRTIDEFLGHFFLLVKNRISGQVKILMIELDPWILPRAIR